MSLTYSHDPSQRPMYKGLRAREGYSFSLTSPSLFLFEHSRQVGISLTEKRRVTVRETTFLSSRNDELLVAVEKQKNRWFTKLWSTNLCTEKIIRTFAVLCEYS